MANELHTLNVNSVSYPITPTQLYLYGSSSNSNYPLVFASGIGNSTNGSASVKNLYTDTENTIYYNPNSNRLTLTGPISTSQASGTWLAGTTTSAALNLTHSGYGAVFSAPLKTGRMSVSTYASNDSKLYFNYFANGFYIKRFKNSVNIKLSLNSFLEREKTYCFFFIIIFS